MTDNDARDYMLGELEPLLKGAVPVSWERTAWEDDEFSQGSYSFTATGASPADYAALRAGIEDRIFFAGEHTNFQF